MPIYKAPLRDMRFVLYELMDGDGLAALPGLETFDRTLTDAILDEAARLCETVLFPLNRSGDEEGCRFENGTVATPDGFAEAYRLFRDGGWTSLACDPAYGGQGAPATVATLFQEMMCSANLSFGTYPGLSHGAYVALHGYASEEIKARYLPKLVDGTWSGTMCLTEPHCGTDLGLIRTSAEPREDGSHALFGTKIFISAGEHDLTENIVHLVLARLPGAPKGTAGISLFVVPKYLPAEDGRPGLRNAVACGSIEHKMGIRASSTCLMNFDGATGWLVGEPHKGMRAMFAMMNAERLAVGVQGLGLGEVSYQNAVAYARDRLQGRSLAGAKAPERPADPILVHPDVRRMLLTARAHVEGCRALALWAARALDDARHHPDPSERRAADDFVQLVTPVVKALLTDLGFETTNLGVQVFGGHGYIREHGQEQHVRDARIAQIYEGTNGIQALDLVGRKMPAHAGRYLRRFFHPVADYIDAHAADPELAAFVGPLAKAFGRLQQATATIARRGLSRPEEAGAAASEYLHLFGLTALAYLWARTAEVSLPHLGETDPDGYYRAKVATARFFMERILPRTGALSAQIMAGARTMMDFEDAAF
ncbi:acyl-CoA dehydrogenase C-terminal domain-containing protein [Prosthecodimorpha staleyi]|uniref:3-methylmercaptopropionyl-CoA dehydrogenase n=1 Tax=Prosthecodimorpha staleyi TaxID=2840188 RepID=A0A947D0B6_9HYPH|nr:acyl-CoA dehydrogenase C-terminal domain-containing protein [Prosthecodimorpha staleyi]MBT9288583.1 acyl-CoA dehydrogenase C-terminal domain-containing protein [Prosthecodimorpha staleyi]